MRITSYKGTKKFLKQYRDADAAFRALLDDTLKDLMKDPVPKNRRLHSLAGTSNPKIFTIDVTTNKSHKLSIEIDGTTATIRRFGTHKEIDRNPQARLERAFLRLTPSKSLPPERRAH